MNDSANAVVSQDSNVSEEELLIPNKSAENNKFIYPKPTNYPIGASILSILSLFLLAGLSAYYYKQIQSYSLWVTLPFIFTVFGASIGALLEIGLLFSGTPFQLMKNGYTKFIQRIRFLNLGPLMSLIFFFVTTMVVEDANTRIACLFLAFFMASALSVALYYGGAEKFLPLIILGIQILQLIIVIASGEPFGAHWLLGLILIAQALFQTAAFIVTTATPIKSTGFHILSAISGTMLYFAVLTIAKINPDFSTQLAPDISLWSVTMWGLLATALAGIVYTMKASPMTYSNWRVGVSNFIWGTIYFELISQKRFPYPVNLTELYGPIKKNGKTIDRTPEPSVLQPYYQQHPEFLPQRLSIPSVEKVEGNVTAFGDLVKKVKMVFKVIAMLDHYFPQANINIPLKDKPRMPIWSDGKEIFPKILTKKLFGKDLPFPQFKETPKPAIKAYKEGQLLAHLAESGIANPFLKKTEDGTKELVIDLRFLEKYECKKDYEPYGGMAYFKINTEKKKLELVSVVAPKSDKKVLPNPMDATFRHVESMVLASIYYQVISGKHLSDIHMSYNLLEVVLHNAFDAKGKYNHPLRTFMYIHLFSHELAEEFTTEHLVQEGAVFSQIFATTHDSLINHLNECYSNFEYASDEDFDYRKEIMTITHENGHKEILPNACIKWELEYVKIWNQYTKTLIDTIYKNDEEVQKDKCIADMYKGLKEVYFNRLPSRYDEFKTKKGLSRWALDTIHHLIIRHQVYGTTGINAAMDPRISSTQVPTDGGTPGINEWRSLMSVGLATACARFTLLLGKGEEGKDPKFLYLLKGVDRKYEKGMKKAFSDLHDNLEDLNKKWTETGADRVFNKDYFRALPSDLRTGPGY